MRAAASAARSPLRFVTCPSVIAPTANIGFSAVPEFRIVLLSTVVVARLLMALPTMLMPVPAVNVAFDTSVKYASS